MSDHPSRPASPTAPVPPHAPDNAGTSTPALETEPRTSASVRRGARSSTSSSPRDRRGWGGKVLTGVAVLVAVGTGYMLHGLFAPAVEGSDEPAANPAGSESATVWTCSMHPQVRQPKPGKCPICGMDLIPATSGGGQEATSLRELSISREARELLDIQVAPVERRLRHGDRPHGRQGRAG